MEFQILNTVRYGLDLQKSNNEDEIEETEKTTQNGTTSVPSIWFKQN